MAKYWIYLNDKVMGPYELDQLIRVSGFSRQSMVSIEDYSGKHGNWISPAEIPELARIFQKVEALHDAPIPNRPPPKQPKPKMPAKLTPVAAPVEAPKKKFPWAWVSAILACLLIAGGLFFWNKSIQQKARSEEREMAQTMVETAPLPSTSQYATLRHYLEMQRVSPRWEFDRLPSSLYNVSVSWMPAAGSSQTSVYAFEVNLQAQTVRGLNTAGTRLLNEGFPAPTSSKPTAAAPPAPPKKSPGDFFPSAINERRQAFEQGDFEAVWDSFSKRRKSEMSQGGINETGFMRMQKLTYRSGSGLQQSIVKTKQESETQRLVLLRQTQPKHPDIFIKQSWVWEDNAWKLDEEDKKIANTAAPLNAPAAPAEETGNNSGATPAAPTKSIPAGLPGFSDLQK